MKRFTEKASKREKDRRKRGQKRGADGSGDSRLFAWRDEGRGV